jgi:hypothetical protein
MNVCEREREIVKQMRNQKLTQSSFWPIVLDLDRSDRSFEQHRNPSQFGKFEWKFDLNEREEIE